MSDPLQAALLERAKREQAARGGATENVIATTNDGGRVVRMANGSLSFASPGYSTTDPDAIKRIMEGATPAQEVQRGFDEQVLAERGGAASVGAKAIQGVPFAGEWIDEGLNRVAPGVGDNLRQTQAAMDRQRPGAALGAQVGGGVAGAVPMALGAAASVPAMAVSSGTRLLAGVGAGAAFGGLEGAASGAGRGEDGRRGEAAQNGAIVGAALGGVFGGLGPEAASVLAKLPKAVAGRFRASARRPTVAALRQTKSAAYRAVDQAGETFSPTDMAYLYAQVRDVFEANNYVDEVDSASRAVLRILEKRQEQPGTTLSQLDGIRQNLWKRYSGAKDQPQILDAIKAIDDLIDSRAGASELMGAARAANARYAKSQLLEDAFQKAADQTASAGSGGNTLNKMRQAVTSIINNPRKAQYFSQDEIDMMRQFVRGNMSENAMRLVGKLSPEGNGLMMALHTIGGVASSGASVPLMVAGAAAKRGADASAERGAQRIMDVLAGSKPVPSRPQITGRQIGNALLGASGAQPVQTELPATLQNPLQIFR